MLRTNLSTRPFYNERAVHVVLAIAAALVLVLTAYNAIRIISLSRQNTEFAALINRDRSEAQRLTAEAQTIRAGINQEELQATAAAAAEANRLIDQRTFSWTEFFNRIEETLPADVMLSDVRPTFQQAVPVVSMTVLGRRTEDVDEFIEKLEATGAFGSVLPMQEDRTDEGMHRVQLRASYTQHANAEAVAKPDADAAPGAARPDADAKPAAPEAAPADTPAQPAPPPGTAQPGTGREGAPSPEAPAGRTSKPGRAGRGQ